MNEIPAPLHVYRDQLRDAVDRDLQSTNRVFAVRRPPVRLVLPSLIAAVAAVAITVVFLGAGPHAQPADAAILHRLAVALAPPPGTILHEQAEISMPGETAQPFELWVEADSPQAYRVIKWGHEAAWNGSSFSTYDAGANTITAGVASPLAAGLSHEPIDPAATLRSLVQSGQATVDGTTTINGVSAYKLTVTSSPDPFLVGSAYVATTDYRPLEIDTITNSEKIVYQTYEYLPATSANLQLLDLSAQHPGATVTNATAGASTTTP
jgi:hypothetical protein